MDQKITNLIEYLGEMTDDQSVPRNVKAKMAEVVAILKSDVELSIKKHKVAQIFDDLQDDSNIDSYTRTQLWSVVPLVESL